MIQYSSETPPQDPRYQSPIRLDRRAEEIHDGVGSYMWSLILDEKV
jgi:hypothetical protein